MSRFFDDGIFDRLLAGVFVARDVARFEESFEAFSAGGHSVIAASQIVSRGTVEGLTGSMTTTADVDGGAVHCRNRGLLCGL